MVKEIVSVDKNPLFCRKTQYFRLNDNHINFTLQKYWQNKQSLVAISLQMS